MIQSLYVKTSTFRFESRLESTNGNPPNHRDPAFEGGPGGAVARVGGYDPGTDSLFAGGGTGLGTPVATAVSPKSADGGVPSQEMGGTATGLAEPGRGRGVPCSVGRAGSAGGSPSRFTSPGRAGGKAGPENRPLGGVPSPGAARMAESGPRHAAPEERSRHPGGVEKKLPETLAAKLTPEVVQGRPVRLMFQDEARFGRMVRPKRCWAPAPLRPVMGNGYEREFVYVYGAVSPLEGEFDWRLGREMNTLRMAEFLAQVSQAHPAELIVMVVDGASSHKAKDLPIPDNIRLLALPPYSPQLNPQEHVWDDLREKEFPNRVFNHLDGVIRQLEQGLPRLAADAQRLRSLTAWPWIVSLNLTAH
jgi:hypothetical protein